MRYLSWQLDLRRLESGAEGRRFVELKLVLIIPCRKQKKKGKKHFFVIIGRKLSAK